MKADKVIHHKPALELIKKLTASRKGNILAKTLKGLPHEAKLTFLGNYFSIRFASNDRSLHLKLFAKQLHNVEFHSASRHFVLRDFFVGHCGFPVYTSTTAEIFTKGFSKKKRHFFRLIIPVTEELEFFFQLEKTPYTSDLGFRSSLGFCAIIHNEQLMLCSFSKDKKQHYISIDSNSVQSYESFSKKAYAFLVAIGYITGHLAGTRGYFFAYDDIIMKDPVHILSRNFRPEIITKQTPINWNPYAYVRSKRIADRYYKNKTLSPVSSVVFSKLSQKAYDSIDFQSALILILESGAASLLFRPGGYAIALETLSDLIVDKHVEKLSPIKDKLLSKTIRKECTEVIKRYRSQIDDESLKTLLTRIEQLNQITNKSRLKAPFDLLGIYLLPADHQILLTRNDFLHGRIPDLTEAGENRSLDRINNDLYYASERLYTLLSLLILKWIGYDGYVINHARLQASFCNIRLKESPYRKA